MIAHRKMCIDMYASVVGDHEYRHIGCEVLEVRGNSPADAQCESVPIGASAGVLNHTDPSDP